MPLLLLSNLLNHVHVHAMRLNEHDSRRPQQTRQCSCWRVRRWIFVCLWTARLLKSTCSRAVQRSW